MLPKISFDLWILVACLVIPFLCLMTTIILVIRKGSVSTKNHSFPSQTQGKHATFEDEIAFQVACQHLDMLLVNIMNDIEKQRRFLQGYIDGKGNTKPHSFNQKTSRNSDMINRLYSEDENALIEKPVYQNMNPARVENSKYKGSEPVFNQIKKLVDNGLDSKQISDLINLPQSEIDLYIKLHFKREDASENHISSIRAAV